MSSSESVAPYQSTQLKLGYYLAAAIVSGMVAVPAGMMVTKMLATRWAPAPAAIPGPGAPTETGGDAVAPRIALPAERAPTATVTTDSAPPSVPAQSARSDGAPGADAAPAAVVPAPGPAAIAPTTEPAIAAAPPADATVDLDVASGMSGNLDRSRLGTSRTDRAPTTAHAAVRALLDRMAHPTSKAQAARRAMKPPPALAGKPNVRAAPHQQAAGAAAVSGAAGLTAVAVDLDQRHPRPVVLGGPAATSVNGINGTAIRRRP